MSELCSLEVGNRLEIQHKHLWFENAAALGRWPTHDRHRNHSTCVSTVATLGLSPEECPGTAQRLAWHPQAFPASLSMFCLSSPRHCSSTGKTVNQIPQFTPLIVWVRSCFTWTPLSTFPHLINALLHFRLLSFSAGKNQICSKDSNKLQFLMQTICLFLNSLHENEQNIS